MIQFCGMSQNINIQELSHKQSELQRIEKINYNFKNILRALGGELETIREVVGIEVHNDLIRRDDDNCHPLKAVSGLLDKFKEVDNRLSNIKSSIQGIDAELQNHEDRIRALEEE